MLQTTATGGVTLYLASASALGVVVPPSPVEASRGPNALAVACGPMFSHGVCDFLLRDSSSGASVASKHPTFGATVSVVDGVAQVHRGAFEGAPVAVQGYPSLMLEGAVTTSPDVDAETTGRVGLAVMRDGRVALAVGSMSMDRFARALRDAGARDAVYLDGGSSTWLRTPEHTHGVSGRRLPSFVVFRGADHTSDGASSGAGGLIVGAVVILVASRRRARR